ncbi:hypothetical protein TBLA_0J01360 [Henningerozyma blattae CBS 6284]|uniref:N-acetyltransferase domain-containing protein n=1 Tax=Henningerozyma blattae (strain ATCC 34711 / CBS 6284 / DSM 70876 / NBRC 10599 / NRRL Y-10934 / UCD 77-7) TaxID=1071380 RepID=I2H9T0_HENB6|nr:hypothetical protein TBLA_0J01360 [Tetrapisispora blattae CBS 6284]CCH63132.1 hypothetical protein TBLA_0J01360 [Tetrapisispora blattae CBS 6284]
MMMSAMIWKTQMPRTVSLGSVVRCAPCLRLGRALGSLRLFSKMVDVGSRNEINTDRNFANTRFAISQLLNNIHTKTEIDQYLTYFTSVARQQFAIIKIESELFDNKLDQIISCLAMLYHVGLFPIVVHGTSYQVDRELHFLNKNPNYIDGIRVTDEETLQIVKDCFLEQNRKLVDGLKEFGVNAVPMTSGIFDSDFLNKSKFQMVGQITNIKKNIIEDCLNSNSMPILTSLGTGPLGQLLNINSDHAVAELTKVFQPLKVLCLNETGGFYDGETGKRVSMINLEKDFDRLINGDSLHYSTKLKLKEIKELLDYLPKSSSVTIVRIDDFANGLFTGSGVGTTIKKGYQLKKKYTVSEFSDLKKLRHILIKDPKIRCGKENVSCYLRELENTDFTAYYDDPHDVFAVVRNEPNSIPKIDKLLCTRSGWFNNIPEHVFQAILDDYPKVQWIASDKDENIHWHFEKSEGSYAKDGQVLFWRGISDLPDISKLIESFHQQNL